MTNPFIWFLFFCVTVGAGFVLLWRKAIGAVTMQVTEHAKLNARSYIRGSIYVAIAAGTAFKETFEKLSSDVAAVLPWWQWLIMFGAPVLAGLVTLGAFLDNSSASNRATPPENK